MAKGLSHLVFIASTEESYYHTIDFYKAFGFKVISVSNGEKQNEIWLKLDSNEHAMTSDIVIKLTLSVGSVPRPRPDNESDWSLNPSAIALSVMDVSAVKSQLDSLGCDYQDRSIKSFSGTFQLIEVYCLDPLNNTVIFSNKPSFPSLLESAPAGLIDDINEKQDKIKKIGVLTSGGDAPGMNACVRAVVRYGISKGCEVFAVYEGYQGLVDGGIKKMDWKSVRGYLSVGGTSIGTARCMTFKTREGRLQAAENLIKNGIDALIVCGGDGSLTGADVFRSEWSGLNQELLETGRISEEEAETFKYLTIVGLVGSIDNDMSSTDITIGAVTSLHRICESVDSIGTTALSHSRAFVIEVMGRHCGWLALAAGIATGADFVFIPERPPPEDNWEETLCAVAHRHRKLGKRKTVVIVAEGALDKHLNPIKADHIKDILSDRLGLDTRVTTLGHTQRGGSPAAYDRILATIQSVAAVDAVLSATPETPSPIIGMSNNEVTTGDLMKAVELTHEVAQAIGEKNFARAMELRDPQFIEELEAYTATTILDDDSMLLPPHRRLRIGIIHVGAPAGDVRHLMAMYMDDAADKSEGRIILRNESVSKTYTTQVISDILKEEGHALFDSRTAVLGHIQQGVNPSPLDRIRATRLAKCSLDFFEKHTVAALDRAHSLNGPAPIDLCRVEHSAAIIGLSGSKVTYRCIKELVPLTDMKNRKPLESWWLPHRPLVDLLSGRGLFTPQAQATLNHSK
ncbi:Putative 6-phosphofructokinase [Rhizopus microsporus]|nr:Putative 6-phosphofructokinase [Rhizopus microsporus]